MKRVIDLNFQSKSFVSAFLFFSLLLLMVGGVKTSADTLGDYVEGDTPQVVENTAESYGFALSVALDVIQGEKSVPDAYAELVEYSINNGCDNLDLIINGGVIGVDMSPREFVNALTNGIRQGIADGGGQVSAFPVGNTNGDVKRFNLSDGTYVEWFLYGFQYNYCYKEYDYAWWGYNYYNADGGLIDTVYANDNSLLGSWADVPCYAPMGENIWNYVTISIAEVTDTNILWRIDKYVFSSSEDYYTNTKYITQNIENSGLTGEKVIITDNVDNLTDEELIILIDHMIDELKRIDPNTEETNGLLQAILNKLNDIYDKMNNSNSVPSGILNKLDEIIKLFKRNNELLEILTQEKTDSKTWSDVVGLFNKKFQVDKLKENIDLISLHFFGQHSFTTTQNAETGETETLVTVKATTTNASIQSLSYTLPSYDVCFQVGGATATIDLWQCISSFDGVALDNAKEFISLIMWAGFLLGLWRSLPNVINNASQVYSTVVNYYL